VRCAVHVRTAVSEYATEDLRRDAANIDAASFVPFSQCIGNPS
jgi:hypothetical protein